jgi:hypothetical protein
MTEVNQTPTSIDWNTLTPGRFGSRPLDRKSSTGLTAGARGFAGVEYFFARKMSIGAELGFGFLYGNSGQTTTTTQSFNAATNRIDRITARGNDGGSRKWNFNTEYSGNIFLMFHF